jgi:hypothetical protein
MFLILNGTEEKRNIWTDTPYSLANATWYGHRKLVRNSTYWFACFDRYGDENYNYQTVVVRSTDGVNWEDTGFPFTPNGGVSFAYPNIAVDASGRIHLCASDNTNNTIKYCVYENDAWGFVETLPSLPGGGYVDADIIVLIDSGEKPHVVFATGGSAGKVYYSNKASGSWSPYEAVQPIVTRYSLDSAAIDKNDNIHITMVSMTDYFIYYSKGKAGAWSTWEKVFDGTDTNGSDIAVDSVGKPYVVLARGAEVSLYTKDASWVGQQISSMPNNIHPNIHISEDDKLYLSWGQSPTDGYTNQQVFFCSNENGSWSQPVNISRDDTLSGWAYSVVWADATACGVIAMNYDYTHICGWFAGGTPATYSDKWGGMRLNLTQYIRNEIGQLATEKSLIPYIRITAPQSRLISTGRSRERRSVGGWATKEDFDQIENDYETYAKKKAEFHDGTVINPAIIEELSGMKQKGTQAVNYEITFLEV